MEGIPVGHSWCAYSVVSLTAAFTTPTLWSGPRGEGAVPVLLDQDILNKLKMAVGLCVDDGCFKRPHLAKSD